ncbi:hypothetical protein SMD44_08719 [Streptomyces alboflavus]|uniref:Uncharacterized protein n=1 Tax=Streptomyces alboflavus TaxID=67267 RepID=A0A1Z1WSD2_9ACTN|nr:hypothetical protein SMD44_08719 [Streptomyces alboflavus]
MRLVGGRLHPRGQRTLVEVRAHQRVLDHRLLEGEIGAAPVRDGGTDGGRVHGEAEHRHVPDQQVGDLGGDGRAVRRRAGQHVGVRRRMSRARSTAAVSSCREAGCQSIRPMST